MGPQMSQALLAEPTQLADSLELLSSLKSGAGVEGRRCLAGILVPWGAMGAMATSLAVPAAVQYGDPVACFPVEEHF